MVRRHLRPSLDGAIVDPVTIAAIIAGITTLTRIVVTSAKTRRDLRDLEEERQIRIERERQAEELITSQLRRIAELEAKIEARGE